MAARRAKHSYLRTQFNRIVTRRGVKKAVVAVAASILTSAYFILRDGVAYRDLGPDYLDRRILGNSLGVLPNVSRHLAFQSTSVQPRRGFLIGEGLWVD